jgi:hypothetical protein
MIPTNADPATGDRGVRHRRTNAPEFRKQMPAVRLATDNRGQSIRNMKEISNVRQT